MQHIWKLHYKCILVSLSKRVTCISSSSSRSSEGVVSLTANTLRALQCLQPETPSTSNLASDLFSKARLCRGTEWDRSVTQRSHDPDGSLQDALHFTLQTRRSKVELHPPHGLFRSHLRWSYPDLHSLGLHLRSLSPINVGPWLLNNSCQANSQRRTRFCSPSP